MNNKYAVSFAFAAVMGVSAAQAADMPMTTDEYINDVVRQCFNEDLSAEEDKWELDACVFAVANSNRDLAYKTAAALQELGTDETLHTADIIDYICSPEDLGPWLENPTEINQYCVDAIGYAGQFGIVNEFQLQVMHLAPMAHTGFKSAQYNVQASFVRLHGLDRLDAVMK